MVRVGPAAIPSTNKLLLVGRVAGEDRDKGFKPHSVLFIFVQQPKYSDHQKIIKLLKNLFYCHFVLGKMFSANYLHKTSVAQT